MMMMITDDRWLLQAISCGEISEKAHSVKSHFSRKRVFLSEEAGRREERKQMTSQVTKELRQKGTYLTMRHNIGSTPSSPVPKRPICSSSLLLASSCCLCRPRWAFRLICRRHGSPYLRSPLAVFKNLLPYSSLQHPQQQHLQAIP
jgi:hypothetical protein